MLNAILWTPIALLLGYGAGRLVANHGPGPERNAALGLCGAIFCAGVYAQWDVFPYLVLALFFSAHFAGAADFLRHLPRHAAQGGRPALPRLPLPPVNARARRPLRPSPHLTFPLRHKVKRIPNTTVLKV